MSAAPLTPSCPPPTPHHTQADILMVTDGEIPSPDASILATIKQQHEEMGLEVHGLIVSSQVGWTFRGCSDLCCAVVYCLC